MNALYLMILTSLLIGCASRQPVGSSPPSSQTAVKPQMRHDYLTASDLRRIRHPEFVKTYHIGRKPSKNGSLMHEAHRVYKLEKSPRWNLQRNNPTCQSTGPVRALRDSAFRPLPPSNQLHAEKLRQRQLTQDLEMTRVLTEQQFETLKARVSVQDRSASVIARLSSELKRERQARVSLENQLKSIQPPTDDGSNHSSSTDSNSLKQWGEEQPSTR